MSRFLDELRPFQLDVVFEGAQALRNLQSAAGDDREFFEISACWGNDVWSDARANDLLKQKLRNDIPPDVCAIGRSRPRQSIGKVLDRNSERLMAIRGVVGVGHNGREITVYTNLPVDQVRVPKTLSGYPVVKEFTGDFVAEENAVNG